MRNGLRRKNKATKEEAIEITESCGNVFADLGLPDAEELLAKAPVVQRIDDLIRERRLTVKQAASSLGIKPSQLSSLLRGQLQLFSFAQLLRFLKRFDQEIQIQFKPLTGSSRRGIAKLSAK